MTLPASLAIDLEAAVGHSSAARRADMLRQVTDLFLACASVSAEPELAVFDDVIVRLADKIETPARVLLAHRLAKVPNAPVQTIRGLAFDDDIDVAGPVLMHSERLRMPELVQSAETKGQPHLLAIAQRRVLREPVTDILVDRGERPVVLMVAQNRGARLSERGFGALIRRAEQDDGLAAAVGARLDIPPHLFLKLLAKASERVRSKLRAENPRAGQTVDAVVTEVTKNARALLEAKARDHKASVPVGSGNPAAGPSGANDAAGARVVQLEEAVASLAGRADMPLEFVGRAMDHDRSETVLLLAKAAGLGWSEVKALLLLKAGAAGISGKELEQGLAQYERLKRDIAQQLLRFHRSRSSSDQE